jgi:dTDP-4-dehydrorhamnose reductase
LTDASFKPPAWITGAGGLIGNWFVQTAPAHAPCWQVRRLFKDEFRSPIAAAETARAVWQFIAAAATGTYHAAGSERLSRWRNGELLAARCPKLHPKIEPASLTEYRGASRPPDTSRNCAKAEKLLGTPLPRFSEWLAAHPTEPL